jgi:hypothetical protein
MTDGVPLCLERRRVRTMARSRPRWLIGPLSAMLVVVLSFVSLAAVVGPGRAIYWAGTYLIPTVVIVVVVVGTVVLVAREGGKVLDGRDQPPSTNVGTPPSRRGLL